MEFSTLIGLTNYADLNTIKPSFLNLTKSLKGHASGEETFIIAPLKARNPAKAVTWEREHAEMEEEIQELLSMFETLEYV